jgi:glutathione S-transferase
MFMLLYYSRGACSLAVRITMHEIGIAAQFEAVDLKTKKTHSDKDYLTINPKGAVPALVLDTGEVLTENAVIQQYLADKYQAVQYLPPIGEVKRYRVLEWLNFISTDLHKGCGPFFNPHLPNEIKETIFKPNLKNKLNIVEKHLSTHTFLLGETFTLADPYLFVILSWLSHFGMDITEWPSLKRYFENLKKRKSIEQAMHEEKLRF